LDGVRSWISPDVVRIGHGARIEDRLGAVTVAEATIDVHSDLSQPVSINGTEFGQAECSSAGVYTGYTPRWG
jgi:hypothetical protein